MLSASLEYHPDLIVNADETQLRTHALGRKVIAHTNRGKEGRKVDCQVDPKEGVTCIVGCTLSGNMLPSLVVKKSNIDRTTLNNKIPLCISNMKLPQSKKYELTILPNGWSDEVVWLKYINNIIIPHMKGKGGVFISDCYSSHRTVAVIDLLKLHNIKVI